MDSYRYRDPLEVLLADEARTCRGCIHLRHAVAFGVAVTLCMAKNKRGKHCNPGHRCKRYRESA
jgi:hypothetical protein